MRNPSPAERRGPAMLTWVAVVLVLAAMAYFPDRAIAQSPELSMREFSSGQIKKGVRSIGFGGDGATWGNYGLVWKDAATALVDYGDTHYGNGNDFQFEAVGMTTPYLWHRLAVYVIAMFQETNNVRFSARSPGLGSATVPLAGKGSDRAIFSKIAMPIAKGVSAGVLLSHETSQFDAAPQANAGSNQFVHWETKWRPSGGFGVAWQPNKSLLFGFRGLLNNDLERRTDSAGTTEGMAHTKEFRFGASASPWTGALVDVGTTRLERSNAINGTHALFYHPNLGFEQAVLKQRLTFRGGLDETSPTAGFSAKFAPFKVDAAYVDKMARSRVGNLFGLDSRSFLVTLTVDYAHPKCPQSGTSCPNQPSKNPLDARL
jgi:hypothetical protein